VEKVWAQPEAGELLTRLYVAGLDFFWILESVYFYCLPRETELDATVKEPHRLSNFLPGYIKRLQEIAKQLRRYPNRAQSPLLKGMLDLPKLITQQASRLEEQLLPLEKMPMEPEQEVFGWCASKRIFVMLPPYTIKATQLWPR